MLSNIVCSVLIPNYLVLFRRRHTPGLADFGRARLSDHTLQEFVLFIKTANKAALAFLASFSVLVSHGLQMSHNMLIRLFIGRFAKLKPTYRASCLMCCKPAP